MKFSRARSLCVALACLCHYPVPAGDALRAQQGPHIRMALFALPILPRNDCAELHTQQHNGTQSDQATVCYLVQPDSELASHSRDWPTVAAAMHSLAQQSHIDLSSLPHRETQLWIVPRRCSSAWELRAAAQDALRDEVPARRTQHGRQKSQGSELSSPAAVAEEEGPPIHSCFMWLYRCFFCLWRPCDIKTRAVA